MSVKPIRFIADEVRATLDGRKTVTRRVVKPQPMIGSTIYPNIDVAGKVCAEIWGNGVVKHIKQPYHRGDTLWVRETWRLIDFDFINTDWSASVQYKADMAIGDRWHDLSPDERTGWRPSIHMPREAARIFLRVTGVRVERLQEVCNIDMESEGISVCLPLNLQKKQFGALWDSTIKHADLEKYGWAANPWVWVIMFELCEPPEEV